MATFILFKQTIATLSVASIYSLFNYQGSKTTKKLVIWDTLDIFGHTYCVSPNPVNFKQPVSL